MLSEQDRPRSFRAPATTFFLLGAVEQCSAWRHSCRARGQGQCETMTSVLLSSCTTSSFAPTGQTCLVFLQGCLVLFQLPGKHSSPVFSGQEKQPGLSTRKSRARGNPDRRV